MDEAELKVALKKAIKLIGPRLIADAQGFLKGNAVIVAVRLAVGAVYDDIEDVEQWLFDQLVQRLSRRQTIDFYYQLTR